MSNHQCDDDYVQYPTDRRGKTFAQDQRGHLGFQHLAGDGQIREHFMQRYFFDIRDGETLAPDEEGMVLPDLAAVREEAAQSLADLARDMLRLQSGRHLAIEVRDAGGPVVEARFQWSIHQRP